MANKIVIEKKAEVVKEILDNLKESSGTVFVDYRGLTDEELTLLRKKLREQNAKIKVYKNTLTKRALDELNLSLDSCVEGPSAIVFSTDEVSPIKVVTAFAKDHESLSVKGGIIDGKVMTAEEIITLAKLPSKETLLSMLAGALLGTISKFAVALDQVRIQKEANA